MKHTDNKQVLIVLDTLNDAIDAGKKVLFTYNAYGTDFKLHPRRKDKYLVNPYQMVANNGRYYLIGNMDKYDNVAHYRIDYITDIEMTDRKVKPARRVKELENGLNLPKHMAEHMYMFCGPSEQIKLRTGADRMNDLIDWFGRDFRIVEQQGGDIIVSVKCNINAMFYWALQYGPSVEILEPQKLRVELAQEIHAMAIKYGKTDNA